MNYDPYATHVPALALAVLRFGPRVLEVGAGWYSTALLHTMSRQVITLENNEEWAKRFLPICNSKLQIAPDIYQWSKYWSGHEWDVVFVDCDPVSMRIPCVELFLNSKACVVCHDTEHPDYVKFLPSVKYVYHFDLLPLPRTSYLSNVRDVRL